MIPFAKFNRILPFGLCLFIAVAVPFAHAQDDEFDGDDAKTETRENESQDIPEAKTQKVEAEDLTRLSEARKSRSEGAIIKAASEILAKDPKHLVTLNTLAVFYAETKRYGMAKTILKRALRDHANEPALHNNLGVIYLAEKEPRLALESFRKSTQLKSNYRIGAANLASIYLEHRDYTRAISPLEDSYKVVKSDLRRGSDYAVEIANNYGVALMGVGDNSKAADVFEAIMDSNTKQVAPYMNYSILLVDVLKKKKDALRVLSKLKLMTEEREMLRQAQELEKKVQQ